tara:strand:- start:359 stop:502 length:144 start_codon:yes stop_codon:yes gene_type:complete
LLKKFISEDLTSIDPNVHAPFVGEQTEPHDTNIIAENRGKIIFIIFF